MYAQAKLNFLVYTQNWGCVSHLIRILGAGRSSKSQTRINFQIPWQLFAAVKRAH